MELNKADHNCKGCTSLNICLRSNNYIFQCLLVLEDVQDKLIYVREGNHGNRISAVCTINTFMIPSVFGVLHKYRQPYIDCLHDCYKMYPGSSGESLPYRSFSPLCVAVATTQWDHLRAKTQYILPKNCHLMIE